MADRRHHELPLSLAWARGGYTARLHLGAERRPANMLLDSGSSSFAVLPRAYAPDRDTTRRTTALVQEIAYGAGSWAGPVLEVDVAFGSCHRAPIARGAALALIEAQTGGFQDADGIVGLAYRNLDCARSLGGDGSTSSWPWPYDLHGDPNDPLFRETFRRLPQVEIEPLFAGLEAHGIVHNRFAIKLSRAVVRVPDAGLDEASLDALPDNRGLWVLGAGSERKEHYRGAFTNIRIVDDRYYNAELIAVQVGEHPRIEVPPLEPEHRAWYRSNAIFDTGCSFLLLETSTWQQVLAQLEAAVPGARQLIARAATALSGGPGLPNDAVDPSRWPTLTLILRGDAGGEVRLHCTPEQYWPADAARAGLRLCLLGSAPAGWPSQSILGLPLMAGRYIVFDRCVHRRGVLRFADAHWH